MDPLIAPDRMFWACQACANALAGRNSAVSGADELMSTLLYVAIFVLPSVLIGVGVGFYLGRSHSRTSEQSIVQQEREAMLKAITSVLMSAEQMTNDVDRHNTEIEEVGRDIRELHLTGELEQVQEALLTQIAAVVQSNQRLEEDLQYTRRRVEQQAQEIDKTRREARTDALSGVANRKDFDDQLQYLLTCFKREGATFTLVLIDVDHFKWINDTHGHQAGDRVVSNIGSLLKQFIRSTDYVARFGGDEFAILFPSTDLDQGEVLAERIRTGLSRSNFNIGGSDEQIAATFSMGVASVQTGDTAESLFQRADAALYKAKNSGRNQVQAARRELQPT
jgi:diguanylate cyclase